MTDTLSMKRVDNSWPNPVMPFRQEDIIDPVLQVRMLTADVQLTEGILRDAGKTEDGLVKRRVLALGFRADTIGSDCVTRRAKIRHDLLA